MPTDRKQVDAMDGTHVSYWPWFGSASLAQDWLQHGDICIYIVAADAVTLTKIKNRDSHKMFYVYGITPLVQWLFIYSLHSFIFFFKSQQFDLARFRFPRKYGEH
jgi:hypothetical protein